MNKLQINPPEGREIDQNKSDLSKGVIYFKECKKVFSYEDVAKKLFSERETWFFSTENCDIDCNTNGVNQYATPDNCPTESQLESILALNKLCNVAKYLNGYWLPIADNMGYVIYSDMLNDEYVVEAGTNITTSTIYFKTKELAQQAIFILGEEEIRKALMLNH